MSSTNGFVPENDLPQSAEIVKQIVEVIYDSATIAEQQQIAAKIIVNIISCLQEEFNELNEDNSEDDADTLQEAMDSMTAALENLQEYTIEDSDEDELLLGEPQVLQ